MTRGRPFLESEDGQVLLLFALMFLTLLFFVGLAVDAGQLYFAKRTMQEAADAAAFGGAVVLYEGGTSSDALNAATADATKNGFSNGVANTTVTINTPPSSGAYSGNSLFVEVVIVRQVRTSLVPAESVLTSVRARGVAGAQATGNEFGLLALKSSGTCVLLDDGGMTVTGGGGVDQINCSGNSPIVLNSSGRITDAAGTFVVGTASGGCCNPPGSLHNGSPSLGDPYAGFPKPTFGSSGTNTSKSCSSQNLAPAYYANLDTTGSCGWHLTGGIYILRGGGISTGDFDVDETGASAGVVIFLTTGDYAGGPGGSGCGTVSTDNGKITLKAMSTGQWAGMVIYMDPACGGKTLSTGGGVLNLTGTVYAPTAKLMTGDRAVNVTGQVVFNSYETDNANINVTYDSSQTASPILPALVE